VVGIFCTLFHALRSRHYYFFSFYRSRNWGLGRISNLK
jgi:hypothetical protein